MPSAWPLPPRLVRRIHIYEEYELKIYLLLVICICYYVLYLIDYLFMNLQAAGAKYNTDGHTIIDHHIIALCGDGCLQEGVSFEACSYAGHDGLDNLIIIYDSNDVTLDKMADFTQSEVRMT